MGTADRFAEWSTDGKVDNSNSRSIGDGNNGDKKIKKEKREKEEKE